jgi:V-type H+-transporting ATPase subunit d
MLWFNASHGYLDAILRGFKSGLITRNQYTNFTQCESIEGTTMADPCADVTGLQICGCSLPLERIMTRCSLILAGLWQ